MAIRSLNKLRRIRLFITALRKSWLKWRHGVIIHPSASISLSSRFHAFEHGAVKVGADSLIAFKTLLLSRTLDGQKAPIIIGERCFIGGGSVILPGVKVGDGSIVGACSTVFEDVPAHSIVAGNPAKVIRSGIKVGRFGRLDGAEKNQRKYYR
ncbi:hypothetical protein MNBD_ALPHA04-678 [hydrothermal vent metagenome]|uniref:Maltose O-acetyltransferase n=1 Tax=hydrothermal vent metagenome TaxID=652676 RepID=A0A3B0SMM9_9ZZZZ